MVAALGVDARKVAEFRRDNLEDGIHWVMRSGRIEYTQWGVEEIRRALEIKDRGGPIGGGPHSTPSQGQDRAVAKDGGRAMDLRVFRACPNPIWVEAMVNGARRYVRVKNNRGMRPGFHLRGTVETERGLLWAGKCPWEPTRRTP